MQSLELSMQLRLITSTPKWVVPACLLLCVHSFLSLTLPHCFGLTAFGDLIQCALLLACTLNILRNVIKAKGKTRLFWALLALGTGMWLCAQVLWTCFEVFLRRDAPNPFVGDVVLFLHLAPMMMALAVQPHIELDRHRARLELLDLSLLILWWLYLFLFVVIPWQYVYPDETTYGRSFDLLYMAEHFVFLLALVVVWQRSAGPWKQIYANFFGAALLYAFSSILASAAIDFHQYYTGSVYDIPLVAAMAWFTGIASTGRSAKPLSPAKETEVGAYDVWAARLAMLASFVMPLMVAWASFGGQAPQRVRTYRLLLTIGTMMLMGVLVALRQHLVNQDLVTLLRRVQQNLAETQRLQGELVSKEASLKKQAYYDALTDLPNRTLLHDRLHKALAGARRRGEKVALLFLDLDHFKIVNDSLGHSVGDLVLKEVAKRLEGWAREQDTVARLGGDEFVILLTSIKDGFDAAVAAERIMDAMAAELFIRGRRFNVSCSMGISIFPDHGEDCEALIKNADAAMYSAKENGRNNLQVFSEVMNAQVVERLTLEQGLRAALDKKELFLVYQPQMDIASGTIVGLEALLRWQHPEFGTMSPAKFIRIAENSGLIVPIGAWALRTACSQARKWQDEGLCALPVTVNVSVVQFRQQNFRELISQVLSDTGLAPRYLELEVTESLLLSNADMTTAVLRELKRMGLKLAIDDFGTGYSSLSYLKQFPFSKLKIDRSFICDAAVNSDDAAIVAAIISMAKSLGLKVIAEGVETEAQMSFLRDLHCDEIQGYYFSKPLTTDEVLAKLRNEPVQRALSAKNGR